MRYADWDYYTTVYRGAEMQPKAEFDRLSQRATEYINAVTAGEAFRPGGKKQHAPWRRHGPTNRAAAKASGRGARHTSAASAQMAHD